MKNVLITGANSYVGTNVEKWLMREPDKYRVDTLDMKNPSWKEHDFSKYDVVFHVAGIAHNSNNKKLESLYYAINRDLAVETAMKAKQQGVKQLVYMSSMIVFSKKEMRVNSSTIPNPDNFYGDSKLQAEQNLVKLQDDTFCVSIVRSPMVYGSRSKGNFNTLVKIAKFTLVFPNIQNTRSVIYIDNLSEFVKMIIDSKKSGFFHPQNMNHSSTTDFVSEIASNYDRRIWFTKLFNWLIMSSCFSKITLKAFGSYYYDLEMSDVELKNYRVVDFEESIIKSIKD